VDRERFIIAHGLLRTLLGERLGARPEELHIARGPYGKPYIEGTDLRFNLSDTKDALLIAFAHGREIGVDIETMTRTVDHMAVGEHYFTPEEILAIREAGSIATLSSGTVDPPGRLPGAVVENTSKRRFLEFWTRKEAVLKASGVGIMDDLRVLRVDGAVNTMTITHEVFMQYAAESYHLRTWHLGEDHIISVAQEGTINGVRLMGFENAANDTHMSSLRDFGNIQHPSFYRYVVPTGLGGYPYMPSLRDFGRSGPMQLTCMAIHHPPRIWDGNSADTIALRRV
jgi:phosphopantetheinyl transferase